MGVFSWYLRVSARSVGLIPTRGACLRTKGMFTHRRPFHNGRYRIRMRAHRGRRPGGPRRLRRLSCRGAQSRGAALSRKRRPCVACIVPHEASLLHGAEKSELRPQGGLGLWRLARYAAEGPCRWVTGGKRFDAGFVHATVLSGRSGRWASRPARPPATIARRSGSRRELGRGRTAWRAGRGGGRRSAG